MNESKQRSEQSVAFCNAMLGNAQDVISVLGRDKTLLYANPALSIVLGYEPEELMGQSAFDLIHPDDVQRITREFGEVLERPREKVHAEYRSRHKDGSYRMVESIGINLLDDPAVEGVVIVTRDVTERSAGEEALRRSEEKYRSLFENMLEGFAYCQMYYDAQGLPEDWVYLETNVAFETVTGLKNVSGRKVTQVIPGIKETNPELFEIYGAVASTGEPRQFEARVEQLSIDVSVKVFSPQTGFFVAIFEDITERKDAERRLQQTNVELEGFAHTVSHDLRGPLSAIALSNDILAGLLENAQLPDDLLQDIFDTVSIADSNVKKAIDLIEDILQLAEAGQVPTQVGEVEIVDVVRQIVNENQVPIMEKGILFNVSDDLGRVVANRTHMYQLFSNLIDNAIKHNDNPIPVVTVSSLPDDRPGAHRYAVRDNGKGIPPSELDKIFLPFYRGLGGDSGIGLSTVEKIVRVYKGEVKAYNDNGATFEFCLKDFKR